MNHFNLISGLILIGLTVLSIWFPYKLGKKATGITIGTIFGLIISWTFLADLEFLVIFIWPILLGLQLIFLSYWIFRCFDKRRIGIIVSSFLSIGFVLLILSPWLSDWMFSKGDARKLLSEQNIVLMNEFTILRNESGGFMDYYHILEIEISEHDKARLIEQIKSDNNYQEGINEKFYLPELAKNRYEGDTLFANYETGRHYIKAIFYPNGRGYAPTYRVVSISKNGNELTFEEILD